MPPKLTFIQPDLEALGRMGSITKDDPGAGAGFFGTFTVDSEPQISP